jgi:hypothetical protein
MLRALPILLLLAACGAPDDDRRGGDGRGDDESVAAEDGMGEGEGEGDVDPGPQNDRPTMRALIADAFAARDDRAPGAAFIAAKGLSVAADGTVDLTATGDYLPRWEFSFRRGDGTYLTVTWLTDAFTGETRPFLDDDAGDVVEEEPLSLDPSSLPDSDVVVSWFDADCGGAGPDGRQVLYHQDEDDDAPIVHVIAGSTTVAIYGLPSGDVRLACD